MSVAIRYLGRGDTVAITARAVKHVGAPIVVPCHLDTFPPIETHAGAFATDVEAAGKRAIVLAPGEEIQL